MGEKIRKERDKREKKQGIERKEEFDTNAKEKHGLKDFFTDCKKEVVASKPKIFREVSLQKKYCSVSFIHFECLA